MYRYVVITDKETSGGFALGGVEVETVSDAEGAREALSRCFSDKSVGLVALNDRFLGGLGVYMTRRIERSALPVVVPFPDPKSRGEGRTEEFLTALLSRAIGYRIRLRT